MNVHFSIINDLSEEIVSSVEICGVLYSNYIVITNQQDIFTRLTEPYLAHEGVKGFSVWLIDGPVTGPIRQLLSTICGQCTYFYINISDTSIAPEKIEQFDRGSFNELLNMNFDSINNVDGFLDKFEPILRIALIRFSAEKKNYEEVIGRFLIGESFCSESYIMGRINCSDFDALKLTEISSFVTYLESVVNNSVIMKGRINDCIDYLKSLLFCVPSSPSQFQVSSSRYIQDSFPCVYKINSAINYCSYQFAIKNKLLNKAFMHLFRVYEYYCSGALLGKKARFGQDDNYYVDSKKCLGFNPVYKNIPAVASSLSLDSSYLEMQKFIYLRNKFHYTHGDLKVRKDILDCFYKIVYNQIDILEGALNQRRMRFDKLCCDLERIFFLKYDDVLFSFFKNKFFPKLKIG